MAARALCALIMLAVALSGCSASPRESSAASNSGIGDAPSPSAVAAQVVDEANFLSPSGNIGCYLDKSGARCDIVRKTWQPPPAPADCDLDWGAGVSVGQADEASFTCAGDTVLGAKDKLAYGESLRAGDFLCSSDSTAMSCSNTVSGHGFALAREQYELF